MHCNLENGCYRFYCTINVLFKIVSFYDSHCLRNQAKDVAEFQCLGQ
uniref:Uncharacterized protein n=1 Tax=Anguilla anguilla TaxID=7936 RepID=A0A0E9TJX4_ANGAN